MLIGFSGGMGVGKSTAIEIIKSCFPDREVVLVKFAQPLYDMQEAIYDRISPVFKRPGEFKKDRKLLQWLGTDWGRDSISKTLWVDLWKDEVGFQTDCKVAPIIVCDDCRFDNEAEAIHSLGGYVIKLTRPDNTKHAEGGVGIQNHASEAGVSKNLLDFEVENSDTVAAFRDKLVACLQEINQPFIRRI